MKVCGVLADTDTNDKRLLNWKNLLTACLKGNFDERLYSDIDFFNTLSFALFLRLQFQPPPCSQY